MPPGSNARSLRSLALTLPLDLHPESTHLICTDLVGCSTGWSRLGFTVRPTYELLREFINERIGSENLHPLFGAIIREAAGHCGQSGHPVGRRVGEDATDKQSLKHDKEAEYSGYYKHCGYKVDVAHDMDDPSLVLEYTTMSINGDEGKCLIP